VPIAVRCQQPDGFDDIMDELIGQAIEAHGLAFGDGGHDDRLSGVIEVNTVTDPIEARLQPIRR
jgi:integrase